MLNCMSVAEINVVKSTSNKHSEYSAAFNIVNIYICYIILSLIKIVSTGNASK